MLKKHYLLLLFYVLCADLLFCQQDSVVGMHMVYSVNGNNIKIRWQPSDEELYNILTTKGYSVERITIKMGDDLLNAEERTNSKSVLCTDCYPMTMTEFRNHSFNNSALANAMDSLWFGNISPVFTGLPFKDAIKASNFEKNKYTGMVVLTSRDFEVAKAFGLGIEDEVAPGNIYEYKLKIDDKTYNLSVNTIETTFLSAPVILSGYGADKLAVISYNQSGTQKSYIGYFFEKSIDSINFNLINEHPYLSAGKKDTELAQEDVYLDSLNENGIKYFYRMRGQTVFGEYSPYSNIVSVKGIPKRLDLTPILGVKLINETSVLLEMSDIPAMQETLISKVQVFKSSSPVEGFSVVKPDYIISPADREFLDDTLNDTYYYVLTYEDIHGHKYKSNALLVQPKDSIPPLIPVGLTVTANNDGNILVSWAANDEDDLNGYRLYRANGRSESFIDVTGENIRDTFYNDFLSNTVLIDSVYYKMIATDIRGNYSDYTEIVGISRPDAVPPSDPVIFAGIGGQDGIYLNWAPSNSKDLIYHALERSSTTNPKWEVILTFIPADSLQFVTQQYINFNYNYLDNKGIHYQQYHYRLIAYDDNGNFSTSNMITVTPLPVVVEGNIVSFSGSYVCDSTLSQLTLQQFTGLSNAITSLNTNSSAANVTSNLLSLLQNGYISVATYQALAGQNAERVTLELTTLSNDVIGNSKKLCKVDLIWEYASNHVMEEVKFEIYRAVNSYTFDLYAVVNAEQIQITDSGIKYTDIYVSPGRQYNYKIVALNPNNTKSKISKVFSVTIN